MKLISINIGKARTQQNGEKLETTGIYKMPVDGTVKIKSLGIVGDFIGSSKHHGGPDQAIYVYGAADYAWWSKELGKELAPGTFGDNLTISELQSADFNIGDRLHIGEVILEVTAPRIPCSTLATRMGDSHFVKKYRHAERPGLYCRVIAEGEIKAGVGVTVQPVGGEAVSVVEIFRDWYEKSKDESTLRRFLRSPLAIRARHDLERRLERLHF
ncbi:MAG: MOSC domain-containing protein [Anaerolineae bacterium]|nr:MAG: MOSC domain-containing protein [Anaerolineae bacterium]WKZ43233.1 MAG: MOSC domain-containing protein [Anaerolineales bacterium]